MKAIIEIDGKKRQVEAARISVQLGKDDADTEINRGSRGPMTVRETISFSNGVLTTDVRTVFPDGSQVRETTVTNTNDGTQSTTTETTDTGGNTTVVITNKP